MTRGYNEIKKYKILIADYFRVLGDSTQFFLSFASDIDPNAKLCLIKCMTDLIFNIY